MPFNLHLQFGTAGYASELGVIAQRSAVAINHKLTIFSHGKDV